MTPDDWIGWDLGDTDLKAVLLDRAGSPRSASLVACPLWQGLDRLAAGVDQILDQFGHPKARHAVTMTAERADLFESRADGVAAVIAFMRDRFPGETLLIYAGAAGLIGPDAAIGLHAQVASASWMATATLAASHLRQGLLVNVGSTTVDLVPFSDHEVLAWGASDHERLLHGELLYSGVAGTSLIALTRQVPFGGVWVPLLTDHFATTADVYRLTGALPEHANPPLGGDGREKGMAASARRLARMLGLDVASPDLGVWIQTAGYLAECHLRGLGDAAVCLLSRGDLSPRAPIIGAGVGRFLAARLAERLQRPYLGFESLFPAQSSEMPEVADCAPAAAVASLAAESYPP